MAAKRFGPLRVRRRARHARRALVVGLLLALLGDRASAAGAESLTADLPLVSGDGFATSGTCRACHPGAYATWHASFHRSMTQAALPGAVQAPFDGRVISADGHTYRPIRRGDGYSVAVDGVERQVVMVTGSHQQQRFWMHGAAGRGLDLLPLGYLVAEQQWVPGEAVFVLPSGTREVDTAALWNRNCIGCHSVDGQPGLDAPGGPATRVAELGIACEACHGPAAEHEARYRNPLRRYAAHLTAPRDTRIVNPARLPPRDASAICGQCHAVFVYKQPRRWRSAGATYRPGASLDDDRFLLGAGTPPAPQPPPGYLEKHFWSDGEVRVSGREYSGMIASACYQRGDLSCLTCHAMHGSAADDQLRPTRQGDAPCLTCHAAARYAVSDHTHHGAASEGSRCMNCHMPYTTFGLLKAIRSHRISSPSVARTLASGRPDACNLCHLDRSLAWTDAQLGAWYGAPSTSLPAPLRDVAASLFWLLAGDAGQRALAAASMGWAAAQQTSGRDWLAAPLLASLDDPYAAVRYSAARALRTLPGYAGLQYDYTGTASTWRRVQDEARARLMPLAGPRPDLLRDGEGRVGQAAIEALQRQRDDRPVALSE